MNGDLVGSRGGNVATRILFGAGFPDPAWVLDRIDERLGEGDGSG